jgi:hypothetical protein
VGIIHGGDSGAATRSVLHLQGLAGNSATAMAVQRLEDVSGVEQQGDVDQQGTEERPGTEAASQDVAAGDRGNPFCIPFRTQDEAEKAHARTRFKWLPFSSAMFGSETTALWELYLSRASGQRPGRAFASSGSEVVKGFTAHHRSDEAALGILNAAVEKLKASPQPLPPGTRVEIPLDSLFDPGELNARVNNPDDPIGLKYDSPATTIPGNIAGGIGEGDASKDTRAVSGSITIDVAPGPSDADTTGVIVNNNFIFFCHDTIDFCPGNPGGFFAQSLVTVDMSRLEATGERFGPSFAGDVPFDVTYPAAPTPLAPELPRKKKADPKPNPQPAKPPFDGHTTGTLLRVRTGPGTSFPTLRLIAERDTPVVVRDQLTGTPVAGNDQWDEIADGQFVSDRFVANDGPHEDFQP